MLLQAAKLQCHGDYVNIDYNNTLCVTAMQNIKEVWWIFTYGYSDNLFSWCWIYLCYFAVLSANKAHTNPGTSMCFHKTEGTTMGCEISGSKHPGLPWRKQASWIEMQGKHFVSPLPCPLDSLGVHRLFFHFQEFGYALSYKYMNDKSVQKALNVREVCESKDQYLGIFLVINKSSLSIFIMLYSIREL